MRCVRCKLPSSLYTSSVTAARTSCHAMSFSMGRRSPAPSKYVLEDAKVIADCGCKKRSRGNMEIMEACYGAPRPLNPRELANWLEFVLHHHSLHSDILELPEFPMLSLLLDPEFAYVWTPACTKEFTVIIQATGVIFEKDQLESAEAKRSDVSSP
ncbi:hypothetical protein KC19_VG327400 [Ceratodon purpureus]|uniref:Uncharacterized protein n=1 Tax=Ceratodon purpureus TaxID=3225 RepID=A0A8T0HVS4_CERPU|nr:hypothetical protein KC19_VG327400 [Ceratodon purpureus]